MFNFLLVFTLVLQAMLCVANGEHARSAFQDSRRFANLDETFDEYVRTKEIADFALEKGMSVARMEDFWSSFWSMFNQPDDIVYSFQTYNLAASLSCYQNMRHWKSAHTVLAIAKKYLTYGCWCGEWGAGTPVDGIDSCCKAHDKCFNIIYYGLPIHQQTRLIHFTKYRAQCLRISKNQRSFICKDKPGTLGRRLCDCDQIFGKCIHQHDPGFKNWKAKHDCIRGRGKQSDASCGPKTVTQTKNDKCPVPDLLAILLGKD